MTEQQQQEQYTKIEKEAQKWLDETDTMQFSKMELITMFAAHQQVKNNDLLHDVSARLSSSLGECVDGNDYEIVADKDGRFWIYHKVVGSGEPLEQWIDSVLNVR